jgi:group I intron endonuclease
MFYYIYKITNTHTTKFYIGSHKTQDLNDGYFGSGIYLNRSIKKYGIDKFTKEIIEFCNTEDQLRKRETEILDTIRNDNTYNLKFCAMGGNTRERYNTTQKYEYIQKLVNNPKSPIGKKGQEAFNYGKKTRYEIRKKQSSSRKRWFKLLKNDPVKADKYFKKLSMSGSKNIKKAIEKNKKRIIIDSINNTQIFESIRECQLYFNISRSIISKCLKESNDMTIKLTRLTEFIDNYNTRKQKLNELKSQKTVNIQLINLTDETVISYNNIKELMQLYNITYHQANILKTRKIRRCHYSEKFLLLFDNFKLSKLSK